MRHTLQILQAQKERAMELRLTPEQVQAIEKILKAGNQVEVKVEHGKPEIISIRRKRIAVEEK